MAKISKRTVDTLLPDPARDTFLWDDAIAGFGVRCRPSGRKAYLLKYRSGGAQRWLTIGEHGPMTADQARARAQRHKVAIGDGADPSAERQEKRREATVAEVADRYLAEHVTMHNKPSTAAEVRRAAERKIKPALGAIRISALSRADVSRWHQSMAATPYEANRVLAYLSKALTLASTVWELRGDNPAKGIRRFPERQRDRYLDDDEMQRLGAALAAAEGVEVPGYLLVIRLLATTGMRLGEVCGLHWDDVDLGARTIRLRDAKAGARTVHLGAAAVAILAAVDNREGWLAPKLTDPDRPTSPAAMEHVWSRLRGAAGLEDARLHDLRHTAGTMAALGGASAFQVRDLLGHRTLAMTNRYVERAADLVRGTADAVSARVAASFAAGAAAGKGAQVMRLSRRAGRGR